MSARIALRDATASWHARVDAVYSAADLSTQEGYGRFLMAQAAAHLPTEGALEVAGVAAIVDDWPARRRADLIRADLATLGLPVPRLEPAPALEGVPEVLGAVYVLEGSRLGGTVLRRSVAEGLPTSFLGASRSAAWRDLIALLDERLPSREEKNAAISAACDVFTLFERSGRRILG